MVTSAGYSLQIDRALTLAALAHEEKRRKGTLIPYVMHPVHVALILQRYGFPEPLVVAALLHDVIEDLPFEDRALQARIAQTFLEDDLPVGVSAVRFRSAVLDLVTRAFGPEVFDLVMAVTEPKNDGGPPRSWRERKLHQLARLEAADRGVAALKAADLLHNLVSVVRDLDRVGARVMDRFNAGPGDVLWYYETAAELSAARLDPGHGLADEVRAAARSLRERLASLGLVG